MNPISMFSSSEDLRGALHSVLAASYVLCAAADASGDTSLVPEIPWWQALSGLEVAEQTLAQCGQLPRQRLGELLCRADVHRVLARTWRFLGLPPPSLAELTDAFRDAELSSRALRLHGGRDVYGSSNKRLWDLLVAPLHAACVPRWWPAAASSRTSCRAAWRRVCASTSSWAPVSTPLAAEIRSAMKVCACSRWTTPAHSAGSSNCWPRPASACRRR